MYCLTRPLQKIAVLYSIAAYTVTVSYQHTIMLLRLKTNLGISRLKLSRADGRLTLRELKAIVRDTLHVELPKVISSYSSSSSADGGSIDGVTTSAIPNIVLSRDGTRSTIFSRRYDDIHLSDLNIVHGSELYLMGQYVVKERVKVTVNDDGDLLPAGSFYTRIDECDFSQELDGDDDGGTTIHASIDSTIAVISRSGHHPLVLSTHNEHLMQQEIVSPIDDNHLGSSGITFEERADDDEPNLHTLQEDAVHIPCSAYIPVHDDDYVDQQLRSTMSQLPGAAAFIYDVNSSYQDNNSNNNRNSYINNYDLSDYDVDDVRPNSLDEHEWMIDSGPYDDIRPADSTQRLTLLGDDYYSAPFGFSYSDASTTAVMTTPRLSQSDEV
jgi:hypothetical protein